MRDEMAHYLYVLQSVSLNLLEPRMKIPMDPYNQVNCDLTWNRELGDDFISMVRTPAGGESW